MSAWPQFRGLRTVTAGQAPGTVVRCGLTDTMLADVYVSVAHFYERTLDEDRLARGLGAALGAVPEFGGRLRTCTDGGLEIVCDDSGVPMASYQVDGTLEELMGRVAGAGADLVDPVDAAKARAGGLPLFTVRVTRPSAGGTVLGCAWHHAVGDLHSFMLLMRAWSAAVEGGEPEAAEQVEDRDAFLEQHLPASDCGRPGFRVPDAAEAAALAAEVAAAGRANRTVQVYFAEEEVGRLHREFTDALQRRLTRSDVLTAHVVATIRSLDADSETRTVTVPVNLRRPLGLPAGLVGNPLSEVHLPWSPADGPAALAGTVRDALLRFKAEHLNLRSNLEFLRALGRERMGECVPLGFDPPNRRIVLSNWSRFGLYETVFDGQRPVFCSPAGNFPVPWMCWLAEGFGGSGYLLTLVLPTRLAARLRGEAGRAALHRHRRPEDELPAPARSLGKIL